MSMNSGRTARGERHDPTKAQAETIRGRIMLAIENPP
jgi:hypothetical protein